MLVLANNRNIILAGRILRFGGVIVYPTDTAYALGGIFDNKKVIKKILAIKKRKDDKFTLIASSQKQVEKFFILNTLAKKLAKKYWPGPLSLVVSKKYAVRVPDSAIARKLARLAGKPLIATTANVHKKQTPYSAREVAKSFSPSPVPTAVGTPSPARGEGNLPLSSDCPRIRKNVGAGLVPAKNFSKSSGDHKSRPYRNSFLDSLVRVRVATPDLILDAGKLKKRKTSTIVEVSGKKIKIIRLGAIVL